MSGFSLRRGSPFQQACVGLVIGLLGMVWTLLALHFLANSTIPFAGVLLPLAGVAVTIWFWGRAALQVIHVASQQQFAEDDFAAHHLPGAPDSAAAAKRCRQCRAELEPTFRFCPHCGTKAS